MTTLAEDQIQKLAPDASSMASARSLARPATWKSLGQDEQSLWGECQGSALYQVQLSLSDLAYKCSCPSRKHPCKHVLGLMLLSTGGHVSAETPPEWVTAWLAGRAARAERKTESKPVDEVARAKRVEKRQARVEEGLDFLDRWLDDLIRQGLAGLEAKPPGFWNEPAKRLTDAQAPALAGRLRKLGEIPGSGAGWPNFLLAELGKLALLSHAYRRLDQLPDALQADVRGLVGFTLADDQLLAQGERVLDRWWILGQAQEQEERIWTQRTWLWGERTGRKAMILQFAPMAGQYAELIVPGTMMEAELLFWPSACPRRARIHQRKGESEPILARLPGASSMEEFLQGVARALAQHPWLDRFLAILNDVQLVIQDDGAWFLRDSRGQAFRLASSDWTIPALIGTDRADVVGEWTGRHLRVLGVWLTEGRYWLAGE